MHRYRMRMICATVETPLRSFLLVLTSIALLTAQDAAFADRNAVNKTTSPSGMLADSPVAFPPKGALPARFPPDLKAVRYPVESDYTITESPCRSDEQLAAIQAEMPHGEFSVPVTDWRHLKRSQRLLVEGGEIHLLALGDSIVNDTMRSGWIVRLREAYPKARIRATVYVRGGGGCKHYRLENRVQKYLLPLRPDVVFIGGISQGKDYEAIRDVIRQLRDGLPECEILLASGVFGSVDPRVDEAMARAPHSGTSDYGRELQKLASELSCAYLDMTTPWMQYVRSSKLHPYLFYRDRVHANEFGEKILSKILVAYWTSGMPEAKR